MDKLIFTIDKKSFPYRFELYILFALLILFFGYVFIYKSVFLWITAVIVYGVCDYFITSHIWNFYSDRIEIEFTYRNKKLVFPANSFSFSASRGGMYSGHFKIFIKPIENQLKRIIVPHYMYYSNPDPEDFEFIKKYSRNKGIELLGDWK